MKIENLTSFLKQIELKDLYVSDYKFERGNIEGKKKTVNLAYSFQSTNIKVGLKNNLLRVLLAFEFQLKEPDNDKPSAKDMPEENIFKLDLVYTVIFSVSPALKVSEKDIPEEFAKQYLIKMVHPYFRHDIAESLQKAGLPAVKIPLYENI